jgi:hypothetical protein
MIGSDFGWDFRIFWEVGRAVLEGRSPYSVEVSRYPPAAAFLFVIFGLLPLAPAFLTWCGVNLAVYVYGLRRMKLRWSGLGWLLYTPFLFNLMTGQLDVIFWGAALALRAPHRAGTSNESEVEKGDQPNGWDIWLPVLAGAFLTLKPQLAAVILPWFLVRWLKYERGLLLRWGGVTLALHLLPLLLAGDIYQQWWLALNGVSEMKIGVSGGIFVLGGAGLPMWLLAGLGGALALWGWFQDEITCRAAQLSAFPLTIWYDDVLLTGIGPARLMVPLSWLAFVGAAVVKSSLPLLIIPVATLTWMIWKRRKNLFSFKRSRGEAARALETK